MAVFVEPMGKSVNKAATNNRAVEKACQALRDQLRSQINACDDFHGSIGCTIQVSGGLVDRHRITIDFSEKAEKIPV